MQLSQKVKTFFEYIAQFMESTWNFKHFEKNDDPRILCISQITDCEMYG